MKRSRNVSWESVSTLGKAVITTVRMDIEVGCVPQGAVVWILNSVDKEHLPTQYETRMGERRLWWFERKKLPKGVALMEGVDLLE